MKYKITFEFETDELIDKDTFLSEYQCDLEKMLKYWGETPTSFLDGCVREEDLKVSFSPVMDEGQA